MSDADVDHPDLDEDFDEGGTAGAPGAELFDDVVDEAATDSAGGEQPEVGPAHEVQLRDSVEGIYDMVKGLEVQLNHMISINEASERDLEAARKMHRELERERDDLVRRLGQMSVDVQSSAELRDELRHMTRENERLIEQVRQATEGTERWREERQRLLADRDAIAAERDELLEEVDCVETQLARAGEYIETLRQELAELRGAREQESRKNDLTNQRLHVVTEERDALRQELSESRSALEEIRRSIMDTNMQSQRTYYES